MLHTSASKLVDEKKVLAACKSYQAWASGSQESDDAARVLRLKEYLGADIVGQETETFLCGRGLC